MRTEYEQRDISLKYPVWRELSDELGGRLKKIHDVFGIFIKMAHGFLSIDSVFHQIN